MPSEPGGFEFLISVAPVEADHGNHAHVSEMARENTVLVSEAILPLDRYVESVEPYMAGRYNGRQEYLIRVKASQV